jgi:tetratricopeptide (TPR) repeat protein
MPAPLLDVYTAACSALGIPDLGTPGAAGSDPELLDRQTKLARSMWSAAVYNYAWSKASRDRCVRLVAAVLDADPAHVPGRSLAAKIADEDDRYTESLAYASGLLAEGVVNARLHRLVIRALRNMDRLCEAVTAAIEARRRFPDDPDLAALHGETLAELERPEEALEAVQRAVELAPDDPHQYAALGRVHRELDDPDAAKEAFEAALRIVPNDAPARFELGSLLMFSYYDYAGAEREFAQITLPDVGGDRTACLGHSRFLQGKWDLAAADFETALAMPMCVPNTPIMIAKVLGLFGAPERFRPIYERCLAITGETAPVDLEKAEVYVNLASVHLKYGAYAQASYLVDEALRLEPEHEVAGIIAKVLADPDEPEHAEALASIRAE